jgi:hypothetical protein
MILLAMMTSVMHFGFLPRNIRERPLASVGSEEDSGD